MKIVLDEPTPIRELRKVYNDKVTFITTVKAYPLVHEVVISGDYNDGLNKRRVPVRVGQRVDRAIEEYKEKLTTVWENYIEQIKGVVTFKDTETLHEVEKAIQIGELFKQGKITLAQIDREPNPGRRFRLRQKFLEQQKKKIIKPKIDKMRKELQRASRRDFREMFMLGKTRGQILADQELDNRLTRRDKKILRAKEKWNDEFVDGLTEDLWQEYELILGKEFKDERELLDALNRVERKQKSRLPMFAAAVGSVLLAAGTVAAAKEPREDPETGRTTPQSDVPIVDPETELPAGEIIEGGLWHTQHDNRVCPGCEENDAKWFTNDQFQAEAGTNQCLTRCRCIELFEFADKPAQSSKIWRGSPGASIRNWPRFKRK